MSEDNGAANAVEGTNGNTPAKAAAKPKVEVTMVTMKEGNPDGTPRVVPFAGKRNINKSHGTTEAGGVWAQFDLRNGDSHRIELDAEDPLVLKLAGHGLEQKGGDEAAGVKIEGTNEPDVDSMSLAIEDVLKRLAQRNLPIEERWYKEPGAGDSFSGAAVVVQAIMEHTKLPLEKVKAYLEKLLVSGKESGLTRQKLYASFRKPGTPTAAIIERLEKEKRAGQPSAIDAEAALRAMAAEAS